MSENGFQDMVHQLMNNNSFQNNPFEESNHPKGL